jgi:hypothetical protein
LPNLRGVGYIILLDIVNFLEATVYFIMLPGEHWLLVTTVVFRTLLIVALCSEYALILFDVRSRSIMTLQRRASAVLLICLSVALLLLLYPLGQAYRSSRYAMEEYQPVINKVRAEATPGKAALLLLDESLYQRFYPFLGRHVAVYCCDQDELLSTMAADYEELWLFDAESQVDQMPIWIDKQLAVHQFDNGELYHYYVTETR